MRDLLRWCVVPFLIGVLLGMLKEAEGQGAGLDPLALQKPGFPARELARRIRPGFVGGNLDWTFGTSLAPIRLFLETGNVSAWRSHFFNGPGLRNRQLGRYEPHHGRTVRGFNASWERGGGRLRRHLVKRVRAYCALFSTYPEVRLYLSPTLEHNLSHEAFRAQAAVIVKHCPEAFIVDNPVKGVRSTPGFVSERHGKKLSLRRPCFVSLDGEVDGVKFRRFLADHRRCHALLWTPELNCRKTSGPFEDPRKRTNCPTVSHLKRLLSALPPPEL